MMPVPSSSPQIPQKYWDEFFQPPSLKGEDLLIQNIVTAVRTFCLPHDALAHATKH